jgi:Down syndrome cell adhesion protein
VEDQGKYVCEASNGVEKSVETSADLLVFEAPKVRPSSAQLTIKRRDRAEVSCRAVGSPLLSFKWLKNDHPLTDSHSPPHFSIHEEESSNRREKVTLLTIHSVSRNDSGVFSCLVTNDYGSDKGSIKVIVQEPPEAPTDLRILEISSRYVSISWSTTFNGNSPITGYEVVHRAAHGKYSCFFSVVSFLLSPSRGSKYISISTRDINDTHLC